jgi:subtilisin family serine protease
VEPDGKALTSDGANAIHGVNMSLGYDFDPRWFACGQSPICVEVNRLVRSGVVVVVSAGNSGYSSVVTAQGGSEARFNDLSITDPGNAELAITVGSTHREKPHLYGVSYFSSRGPTGDGRCKPDIVAPGERILSCAAGDEVRKYPKNGGKVPLLYGELSGTSMAAPHVSGAIAAFLSVRREFIGNPERVKEIFLSNTVDLRRDRAFQGAGLLDLMKVLQGT